jgi:hypothetical protein
MSRFVVLVCGGREFADRSLVDATLDKVPVLCSKRTKAGDRR